MLIRLSFVVSVCINKLWHCVAKYIPLVVLATYLPMLNLVTHNQLYLFCVPILVIGVVLYRVGQIK